MEVEDSDDFEIVNPTSVLGTRLRTSPPDEDLTSETKRIKI